MNDDVTIEDWADITILTAPRNEHMRTEARRYGGHWNNDLKALVFDRRDHDKVVRLAAKYYGYAPDNHEKVTIRINAYDYLTPNGDRSIQIAGREIVRRQNRDEEVRLAPNVVIHEGDFPHRCGSINNPRITDGTDPSPILEIRDLPVAALDKIDKGYTLVEGDPLKAWKDEKTRLEARLRVVDQHLKEGR